MTATEHGLRPDTTIPEVLAVVEARPWCQGYLAQKNGQVACCFLGAVAIAAGVDPIALAHHSYRHDDAKSASWIANLYRALDELPACHVIARALPANVLRAPDQPTASIYRWNDGRIRSKQQVIDLLKSIIEGGKS